MAMQLPLFPALRQRHEISDMVGEVLEILSSSIVFLLANEIRKFRNMSRYQGCEVLTWTLGAGQAVDMLESRIAGDMDIL